MEMGKGSKRIGRRVAVLLSAVGAVFKDHYRASRL